MSEEVNVSTTICKKADLMFVKMLEIDIPGFIIHARLMHVDEESTNSSYDVYVARNNGAGKSPTIIRDWTMRGAYQPRSGGDKMFHHRNNYGATIYTIGATDHIYAKNNLISAIFDSLLGSCDVSDEDTIQNYVEVARAMYVHGVVQMSQTDQYRASVVTPNNDVTGSRVWYINVKGFMFGYTTWTLNIDGDTRITHRDVRLTTTYEQIMMKLHEKIALLCEVNKVM